MNDHTAIISLMRAIVLMLWVLICGQVAALLMIAYRVYG